MRAFAKPVLGFFFHLLSLIKLTLICLYLGVFSLLFSLTSPVSYCWGDERAVWCSCWCGQPTTRRSWEGKDWGRKGEPSLLLFRLCLLCGNTHMSSLSWQDIRNSCLTLLLYDLPEELRKSYCARKYHICGLGILQEAMTSYSKKSMWRLLEYVEVRDQEEAWTKTML